MSLQVSLRTGGRITAIPRRVLLVVFAAALAALALNWESAGLRVGHAQSGLVAAYNFDEGAGSTVADSSGLGNNGVVAGASWAAGKYGRAASFQDRGDIVTIADHPSLDLANAFTLEAWVRPSSSSNTRTVLIKEVPGNLAYALNSNDDNQRPTVWARSGGASFSASGNNRLSTGTWTHLAATYNGSTLRLYVNGNSVSSRVMTGTLNSSSMALRIGGSTISDEWYRGLIDDVRIYNRALSASEIQTDMVTPVGVDDTTEPEITVTSPADGATISGSVAVSATATDDVGVGGVQFYLDGAILGAEDTTEPYGVTWDTRTAANGTHTLTATGHDAADNTASSTVTVTVNNPPRLLILQPPGGASITGATVSISYSTQGDLTEAEHAHFSLDGGPVQIDLSLDGAYQIGNVTGGAHTLTGYLARADHSQITGSDATPVTFTTVAPNEPPSVALTAPVAGSTVAGNVTVRADATDDKAVAGVQFLVDGAAMGSEDTAAPYEIVWDSRTTTNGPHAIIARARDAAGDSASSTVTVTVNNIPPRLVIVQPPGGATITGTTVAITYSTQGDLAEARHAHFSLDGGPVQIDLDLDGAYQIGNVADGPHTLTGYLARADHSQIAGSDATPITFTTVAPNEPPSVSITAPAAGSTVAGNVAVRADATDDKAVAGVQFLLDGAAIGSEDTSAPYEIVWDSRTTTNGPHAISARARDAAGDTASATVTVTVNNIPPRLVILQPPGGATITGTTVAITYSTQGDVTEARHAHFSLDGGPVQIDLSLDGVYQIGNVTAGAHTLTGYLARADHSQIAGSDATPITFTTVVPNAPPSVAITAPASGSTVAGNVIVRANATDDKAVAGVQFLVDGAAMGSEDTAAPYEIVWDSRTTTNGPHSISARARDAAGDTASATVTVTVNNIPPRLVILQPPGGATITGTTVAITYSTQGDLADAHHVHFALDGGATLMDLSFDGVYQISNVASGAHTLTGYLARADHSRIVGSDAAPVPFATIIVDTPPSVGVTAPAAGSTLVGNVTIRANAADNIAVVGVQFLLDGSAIGNEDTTIPYEITWDSRTTSNGAHAISARARDAAGNTSVSAAVDVTVANIAETGPALTGQWSAPISLPVVAIHQALLPSGQVLMWDAADFTSAPPILWNPQTGTYANMPATSTDLFCVGHAMLANGKLLTVGGDTRTTGLGVNDVNLFDPQTNAWTTMPRMASRRWYPTATTLSDGRVFVLSGYDDCYGPSCLVGRPEIYNPLTNAWTSLIGSNYVSPSYPFLFEMPDGRIIHAGSYEGTVDTRVLDLSTGAWSVLDSNPIDAGSAVMYAPGKIMKAGKWANSDPPFVAAHANTYVMDLNQPGPRWRTTAPMNFPRAYNMLTLLPDGTTLATAGSRSTDPGNGAQGVREAEIWSPDTETWTTMARMQNPRMYHGTSMLLPDGRVIVAGSGRYGSPEQFNAEIFSPPYLFKGARPVITSAPALVTPGQTFAVETPATDVAAVTMVRIGAMTHSFNSDQRFIKLPFTNEGGVLQVAAPANVHVMTPGYYMIFVVNEAGVPSVGAFVRVPATSEDSEPPAAPGNLSAVGGLGQATLTWTAASDNVAIAQYRVHRSTIAGFTPSDTNLVGTTTTTGFLDSGAAGVYFYRVIARDAAGNTSTASNEAAAAITADATAPSVAITAPASGASLSGVVVVSATALDNVAVAGVRFQLDGVALGVEDTSAPYSVSWNSATATAGAHQLTAIARDGAGNIRTSDPVPVTVVLAGPPAGLVAALGFDEGAGTATSDASGLGNHGTLANTSWTPSGRFGSALMFNGTSSWVTVADTSSLDLTSGMTLSAWVRPTSITSDYRTILLKELAPGLGYALYATDGASRPPAGYINTGGSDVAAVATSTLALNTWTHVAVTYDGTAMRIYVNGALVRTTNAPGAVRTSTGALRIGGNSVWGEYFAGTIDEVRVYNRALSASDIQSDMTRAVATP